MGPRAMIRRRRAPRHGSATGRADDAMTLALEDRARRIEAERGRGWTTTPTELDRSRGRGR